MKRSGRVSLLTIVGIACVALVFGLFLMAKESPTSVANRFLIALIEGDANTLADLSYFEKKNPEQAKKDWEYTTKVAGPYYLFKWTVLNGTQSDENNANVKVDVTSNVGKAYSYSQKFEIPLVRKEGQWKVDVAGINRTLFPALPR